jgi:hypothetical protein
MPGGPGGSGGSGGDGYGGAFYFAAGGDLTIKSCQIINCRAIGGNGGAGGPGGDGYLFSGGDGSSAGDGGNAYGGAMYFESDCRTTIENCIIASCSTTQGEGNIGGDGGNGLASGVLGGDGGNGSINGTQSLYGAIHYGAGCEVTVSNTTISNNAASTTVTQNDWPGGQGGINESSPDDEELWGSPGGIASSWTSSLAGGNYYDFYCTVELTDCTISNNITDETGGTSEGGGSEYYESYCEAKFTRCSFSNSDAGSSEGGGQRFGEFCVVEADDCSFASSAWWKLTIAVLRITPPVVTEAVSGLADCAWQTLTALISQTILRAVMAAECSVSTAVL